MDSFASEVREFDDDCIILQASCLSCGYEQYNRKDDEDFQGDKAA